eukprot:1144380-Pelagomonas_calceolata.AAC.6
MSRLPCPSEAVDKRSHKKMVRLSYGEGPKQIFRDGEIRRWPPSFNLMSKGAVPLLLYDPATDTDEERRSHYKLLLYQFCSLCNAGITIELQSLGEVEFEELMQKDLLYTTQAVHVEKRLVAKLRPHQRDGVHFMFNCLSGLKQGGYTGSILMDGMGLGEHVGLKHTGSKHTGLKQGGYTGSILMDQVSTGWLHGKR